jgi:ABC-2 type transport system permease protein
MAGNSIYSLLFFHVIDLEDYIVEGTFDRFLIRPLSPLLQLLTVRVDYNGIGDSVFGITAMSLAVSHLSLHFGLTHWVFMLVMLFSSAILELGLTLALASVAFWTGRSAGLVYAVNQVNWGMTQQYPLEMFGRTFRVLVTTLIPVAFINYYPARFLLGKIAPGDPWYWLSFASPLVALLLLGISAVVWRRGLRAYNSTGS